MSRPLGILDKVEIKFLGKVQESFSNDQWNEQSHDKAAQRSKCKKNRVAQITSKTDCYDLSKKTYVRTHMKFVLDISLPTVCRVQSMLLQRYCFYRNEILTRAKTLILQNNAIIELQAHYSQIECCTIEQKMWE